MTHLSGIREIGAESSQDARNAPNELNDKLARFRERLRSRLTCANLDPPKHYVERDGFEVIIQFEIVGSNEQYEALISRVPVHATDANSAPCLEPGHKVFAGNGRYFENLLHVPSGNASENPEWLAIPSAVRIKRADKFTNVLGKSRYFSLETSRFLWSLTKRRGERSTPLTGKCDALHDVIENAPQSDHDGLGVGTEGAESSVSFFVSPDWISADHEIYLLMGRMRLFLGFHRERFEFEEGIDRLIEVRDVHFGPLGFPERVQ